MNLLVYGVRVELVYQKLIKRRKKGWMWEKGILMNEEGSMEQLSFWNSMSEELIPIDLKFVKDLKEGRPRWQFPKLVGKGANFLKKD